MFDYHMHCAYSADSHTPLQDQLAAAQAAGLREICLTDHVDFDDCGMPPADIAARDKELESLRASFPGLTIRRGAEVGMRDEKSAAAAWEYLKDRDLDFIIASVHMVDGIDAYYPEFFAGHTQAENYRRYLAWILQCLPTMGHYCVLGHYDFCCKPAPYENRAMTYSLAPDLFDGIFRELIHSGKGMEINTSAWRDDPCWGLDIYSRYRELGGEFVTVGADAHRPFQVGRRIGEALDLARAAGIPYVATFQAMQPIFHKL